MFHDFSLLAPYCDETYLEYKKFALFQQQDRILPSLVPVVPSAIDRRSSPWFVVRTKVRANFMRALVLTTNL
ncbi:hypothetical protein QUB75_20135 [Microcoleus sp. K1-B6]|uniref:hypothetical protein n=1 Tax=unclassified Microcoleus TaxID=2642155 RepID=UPI002FD36D5E